MSQPVLLVLAAAQDPYIPMLDAIRGEARLFVGDSADALREHAPEADALLAWTVRRPDIEALLTSAPKLRWMHVRWAGLDSLLFPALIESPVALTNSKGVYSQSLGEFVIAGALFFAKDMRRLLRSQAACKWEPFTMLELRGSTMGIVGYGDIGRASAARASALGMHVHAFRRRPGLSDEDPYIQRSFGPGQLLEMLAGCDYVVAAAPLTPETRGMMGEREFSAMKDSSIFINVGRGPVVNEPALIRALQEKRIRGAALDVFSTEPLAPESPLFAMENVLISPHCADNTPTWNEEAMQFFLDNFRRFVSGQALENVVDKAAGY